MATRMQQRRGTSAEWTAVNPVLASGEVGFEEDTGIVKIGNGSSTWNQLPIILEGVFLKVGTKVEDSERLDGLDSTAFIRTTDIPAIRRSVRRIASASFMLAATDEGRLIQVDGALTVTVPAETQVAIPVGTWVDVVQWGTGEVTILASSGVTMLNRGINSVAQSFKTPGRYSVVRLLKVETNTWLTYQLTQSDTGWIDISANSNFNATHWRDFVINTGLGSAYRVVDRKLYLRLNTTFVNATAITVAADGNINDINVLNAGVLPGVTSPIHFLFARNGVHDGLARLTPDGGVQMIAATAGGTVKQNDQYTGIVSGWPID